ncbi:CLUMA_CG014515, isoform A [Clunio marinus]|uniref:BUD13 homolog n=1 Tax=Clunio marinus TaxID=568069 RepID=A0A1J1IS88_9DIPT|nr:CLUMA_CG014515, isoform A [Clunio marinus]
MSKISQKDYLKKYLSSDDKLRKKKKKSKDKSHKLGSSKVKIIDDDDFGFNQDDNQIDESELFALNEEAPQIVGIIDERAPEVLMKQEYQDSGKWKKIGNSNAKSSKESSKSNKKQKHSEDESSPNQPKKEKVKRKYSSDESPPRRTNDEKSGRNRRNSSNESPPRKLNRRSQSSDNSPPRRSDKSSRKRKKSSDVSPPRKRRTSSDNSPPRRIKTEMKKERRDSTDNSPLRRQRNRSVSPFRQSRSRWSHDVKKEPKSPTNSPPRSSRMTKTLDGKVSGLQDAKTLKRENDAFKERQEKLFREMKPEMSGRNADIVIRDRRGRNKELELDIESERKKSEAEAVRKKAYDRWGKGLKQIEDQEKRLQEFMHEASKPLARSADDQDLQDHLRDQERLDDPMLEYMRRKKQDKNKKKGVEEKPKYQGQFLDNRFNIRPGYRWDGVDRSNGYEKKYFNMVNSKKSMEEEAYRYSTEDM